MVKVLTLIEDEPELATTMTQFFKGHGYKVKAYANGEEFLKKPNDNTPSIFLVDWRLPGIQGIDIIKNLREKDKLSSIFMVSANYSQEDIIRGLKAGADDYVSKPFNFDELLARVESAVSKIDGLATNSISSGLKLLDEAHTVVKDGKAISLTKREYLIFKYLFEHQDNVSAREEILTQFGDDEGITIRNIDVHIFSLRKKIAPYEILIETVWGKGYLLKL